MVDSLVGSKWMPTCTYGRSPLGIDFVEEVVSGNAPVARECEHHSYKSQYVSYMVTFS